MAPTDEHIEEIAGMLECGNLCFFHKQTGAIEFHPDPDSPYFDTEIWQEVMDKIENDFLNYKRFDLMDSRQGFQVMEDFVETLTDSHFQSRLFQLLSERKPFSKFKMAIDNSDYRQNWFDFKKQAYIDWVREQLT